jgi:beta-barrel assembly-enhancing protease
MTGVPGRPGPALENRLPAEGINSSDEHPLKEFAWLIGAGLATILVVVALVGWGARWLAPMLPFSTEVKLAERLLDETQEPADARRSAALQAVARRVAARMELPADMPLVLRFVDSPVVNAYATIGGRIFVHAGLLSRLRSEDELAALLAHEIAHVRYRHVAANTGRGLALALLLGAVSADAGAAAAQSMMGQAASLAMLGYSRAQESQADEAAMQAVVALYGHGGGMMALFEHLDESRSTQEIPPQLLRTHPLTKERLQALRAQAQAAGWATSGQLAALPAELILPDRKAGGR